ncbi:unnamed protein product [Symbiodinium sp. CCMP2592]|nr:unnamed protein product [Symbiodinium sp. CCMP2592]
MVTWAEGLYDVDLAYDWVEFFAGRANCTSAARVRGASGLKLDIEYGNRGKKKSNGKKCKSDYMDINSCSGFCLAIICLLNCRKNDFVAWFGLKCSSWCGMNRATSGRSPSSSTGYSHAPTVQAGNRMLERVYLLCLLVVALGGCYILEQPAGSAVEYYPSWRRLCTSLISIDGTAAVNRVGWYMGAFFARTLKRQYAYSNSPKIRLINRSPLQVSAKMRTRPTKYYVDKNGKKRFLGLKQLKDTENLEPHGWFCWCSTT